MKNRLIKKGICLIIKGNANSGDLAKQYCRIGGTTKYNSYLVIKKYVFTSDPDFGFFMTPKRSFKGKMLYEATYTIRLDTLGDIVDWLNESYTKNKKTKRSK